MVLFDIKFYVITIPLNRYGHIIHYIFNCINIKSGS